LEAEAREFEENIDETEKLIVMNPSTGEIKDVIDEGDKYFIKRKKQIEYYDKNKKEITDSKIVNFGQSRNFTMLNQYAAKQLSKEKLSSAEYSIIFLMISNTNYKSGLITKGNNHDVDEKWIADTLDISLKTAERSIKKFVTRGIIYKGTTNSKVQFFFNPYIQYKGAWINKTLYEMFKGTKWAEQAKEEREKELKRHEAMETSKIKRGLN
jgi:predicted transcriptional regulator